MPLSWDESCHLHHHGQNLSNIIKKKSNSWLFLLVIISFPLLLPIINYASEKENLEIKNFATYLFFNPTRHQRSNATKYKDYYVPIIVQEIRTEFNI